MLDDAHASCAAILTLRRLSYVMAQVDELLEDARDFEQQPIVQEPDAEPAESGRLRSMHYTLRREPSVDYAD